ncbi:MULTISPECIES: hypothetical protein [unclassified Streptomyces]
MVVLDADHLTQEPVATIHLPRRVPAGVPRTTGTRCRKGS